MATNEIFTLSAEEQKTTINGEHYEQFTTEDSFGEQIVVPVRPGIVLEYEADGLGYLIQKTDEGFRWIGVESYEEDTFGPFVASRRAAIQGAVADWRDSGGSPYWADWTRTMSHDASAPERVEAEAISALLTAEVAAKLSPEEIESLASKLAELVNGA